MQGFGPAVQMGALPVEALKEIMLTITRRAKMGNAVEDAFDKIKQPPPPPQEEKPQDNSLQVEQVRQQGDMQKAQFEAQTDMQKEQIKAQADAQNKQLEAQRDIQMEQMRLEFEKWKVEYQEGMRMAIAEMQAKTSIKQSSMTINASSKEGFTEVTEEGEEQPTSALAGLIEAVNNNMQQLVMNQQQSHQMLMETLSRPKKRLLQRGPDGKAIGMIEVNEG
jgi:hypothetical protein